MTDAANGVAGWFRDPARLLDVPLAVGVTLVVAVVITADVEGADPDAWAYLWAVGLGGVMLVRRTHPVIVLALSATAVLTYYAAGYPAIGVAVPLAAAVFSAAEAHKVAAAIVTSLAVLAISTAYRLVAGQNPAVVLGYDLPGHLLLFGAAIALGDSLRARRDLRRQSVEFATLLAQRYRREERERAIAQRLAIARELHDSLGHSLTVVGLHAQIAEETLTSGSVESATLSDAIHVIAETTNASFADLRHTVASLRDHSSEPTPFGIADLDAAIAPAKQAGLTVLENVSVSAHLPPAIQGTIYRIVQESITNVVRHADASEVEIDIQQDEEGLRLRISNDLSTAPPHPPSLGSGIKGMSERALLLGGTFSAQVEHDRFVVQAAIPLEPA